MSTFSASPKEYSLCPLMESERVRNRERKRARERERDGERAKGRRKDGRADPMALEESIDDESVGEVGDKKTNMNTKTETNTKTAIQNSCTEHKRTTHGNTHAHAYARTSPSRAVRLVRTVPFRPVPSLPVFSVHQTDIATPVCSWNRMGYGILTLTGCPSPSPLSESGGSKYLMSSTIRVLSYQ